jgi:hypothetical protein
MHGGFDHGWCRHVRVSRRGDGIDDADTVEGAREVVGDQHAGRQDHGAGHAGHRGNHRGTASQYRAYSSPNRRLSVGSS